MASHSSYDVQARAVVLPSVVAAGCWVLAVTQMRGMDMGVATGLGSFGFFVGVWAAMMAAMMLPGAIPARPHSTTAAVVITIAAGLYELSPIKRRARRRCQQRATSGFRYGIDCLGSSLGLMLLLLAWGAMSIVWMSVIAVVVFVQKLIPVKGDLA